MMHEVGHWKKKMMETEELACSGWLARCFE
jgi:hypothetical protein